MKSDNHLLLLSSLGETWWHDHHSGHGRRRGRAAGRALPGVECQPGNNRSARRPANCTQFFFFLFFSLNWQSQLDYKWGAAAAAVAVQQCDTISRVVCVGEWGGLAIDIHDWWMNEFHQKSFPPVTVATPFVLLASIVKIFRLCYKSIRMRTLLHFSGFFFLITFISTPPPPITPLILLYVIFT